MLALTNKRRCWLSKGVILLHYNLRPHSVTAATKANRQLQFELYPHPPYSPDLPPSDYHKLEPLKKKPRVHDDISVMKLRTRCTRGFGENRNLSTHMTSESLWHATQYALKERLCWEMIHFAFFTGCCTRSNQFILLCDCILSLDMLESVLTYL